MSEEQDLMELMLGEDEETTTEKKVKDVKKKASDVSSILDDMMGEAPKAEKTTPAKKPSVNDIQEGETFSTDWTISINGKTIAVPKEDMSIEDIRAFLEPDFPAMTKQKAKFELTRSKKIILAKNSGGRMG